MDSPNTRSRVLRAADQAVNGDRNAQYGDPNQDFQRTATFWNTYVRGLAERELDACSEDLKVHAEEVLHMLEGLLLPGDVGAMQVLLKLSRSVVSPEKEDHWVDIAGYAACAADCHIDDDPQEPLFR
jgi:hypothetical protein